MIARGVDPESGFAKEAIAEWKNVWWKTTCGGGDDTGEKMGEPSEDHVYGMKLPELVLLGTFLTIFPDKVSCSVPTNNLLEVVKHFGMELINMGNTAWEIQADALAKTNYAGGGRVQAKENIR